MLPAIVAPIDERLGRWPRVCTIQPKLDGVRATARLDHGRVSLRTRAGREVITLPWLIADLRTRLRPGIEYDGEIWAPDVGFDAIQGAVLHGTGPAPSIGLHVFDVRGRSVRGSHAQRLGQVQAGGLVASVPTCVLGESAAKRHVDALIESGHEGAVMRPALAGYGHAWKIKLVSDADFPITGIETRPNGVALTCAMPSGASFVVWCAGWRLDRSVIGSLLTVQHQGWTAGGAPRHAAPLRIRLEQ